MKISKPIQGIVGAVLFYGITALFILACSCDTTQDPNIPTMISQIKELQVAKVKTDSTILALRIQMEDQGDSLRLEFGENLDLLRARANELQSQILVIQDSLDKAKDALFRDANAREARLHADLVSIRKEMKVYSDSLIEIQRAEILGIKGEQAALKILITTTDAEIRAWVTSMRDSLANVPLDSNFHSFKIDSTHFQFSWEPVIDLDDAGLETEGVTYNIRMMLEVQAEDAAGNKSEFTIWDGLVK